MNIVYKILLLSKYLIRKKHILSQYHYWHKIYKQNLKKTKKIPKLTKQQKREIDAVFSSYKRTSYIYNQFYTGVTGAFSPLYIPDPFYYSYIDPFFNDWNKAKYLDHKCLYSKIFPDIKQPKTVAYRINGLWYSDDCNLLSVNEVFERCKKYDVFVKIATESEGGHGVYFVEKGNNNLSKLLSERNDDIIIQLALKQSKSLAIINSSSVNTIRLLSLLKKDGSVKIYSVVLRMGINGSKIDNASSGGLTVGVCADGHLKAIAYNVQGMKFTEHPTSKIKFKDYIIPNFTRVKELVEKAAIEIPFFRLVSWDVALDEKDDPILIEANFSFGELDFHQLNNGPLFGDDTIEILHEVFINK